MTENACAKSWRARDSFISLSACAWAESRGEGLVPGDPLPVAPPSVAFVLLPERSVALAPAEDGDDPLRAADPSCAGARRLRPVQMPAANPAATAPIRMKCLAFIGSRLTVCKCRRFAGSQSYASRSFA